MQDEVNEKTIALCIKGGKLTTQLFKTAMIAVLKNMEQQKHARTVQNKKSIYRGKQSLRKLMQEKCELSNIEITDGNIKSFERYARKYNIDFNVKKDISTEPPRYLVFFRAKDVDVMTAAFREYTGRQIGKERKPSVMKKLEAAKERVAKHREREKTRQKERGPEH